MAKNKVTYRLFATGFLLLMLLAPVAQVMSRAQIIENHQIEQLKQTDKHCSDTDTGSEVLDIASDIQATVTSGIEIKSDWAIQPIFLPNLEIVPLDEWSDEVFIITTSQHYRTICTHYIAPQAP